jgi:glucosamine--fructose-6-phosphate aminotransferase (isomerizing)
MGPIENRSLVAGVWQHIPPILPLPNSDLISIHKPITYVVTALVPMSGNIKRNRLKSSPNPFSMFNERQSMSLRSEILEQPAVLGNLVADQMSQVEKIAQAIRRRDISYIFLAARGTSDNAGRYANYLWGAINRMPLALATPSLFTLYQTPPRLKGALVVGISQSGESPDIVSVLAEARGQDCLTLAITNAPASPLACEADYVIDIHCGVESAVAATKTYTGEMMAIAMLAVALSNDHAHTLDLEAVPGWMTQALATEERIVRLAERYRYMDQCVVLGRGYNYCTAFEWSLKLKELTYVVADPYSSADFLHGPIAMVDQGFPVMAVAPGGSVYQTMLELLQRLRNQHAAELLVISDRDEALQLAQSPINLPSEIPEWLTPLVSIVQAQLFSYYLALTKGYDTEKPRSLHKVTRTE